MADDAVERLRYVMNVGEQIEPTPRSLDVAFGDARAILAHIISQAEQIEALTAERDAAKGELREIANSTGCVDACPCWAKLRRKAERAIASGAHLPTEGEAK